MISRVWVYCIINFVVILPYLIAKPVSLNKLIEAEEALPSEDSPKISKPDFKKQLISLNKFIGTKEKSIRPHRQKLTKSKATQERTTKLKTGILGAGLNRITKTVSGTIFHQNRNLSPLHYRKTFEIKSPIKPKRVTLFQRTNRHRNQSGKRDTYQYGSINQKYIPLLRNLGLLFDNILGADSSEIDYGRDNDYSESEERVCTCISKSSVDRDTRQKTAASSRVSVTETTVDPPQATTTTTFTPAPDNLSTVGRDKNISLLFTRNTTSLWRNNHWVDERSGASHLGSAERHLPGDCGNDECDTRDGEVGTDTEDNEKNPDRNTGDDAGNVRLDSRGGRTGNPRNNSFIGTSIVSHKFKTSPNKTAESVGGHVPEYEGEIQFEIRTDKAKSSDVLSEPDSRLRDSQEKILQATEVYYEDTVNESNKQFTIGNGEDTKENQKFHGTYEGVSLDANTSNPGDKFVMIYDGYSVARDVNGKNTLTEKAITIHS